MIHIEGLNKFFNKGRQNEIHVINDISIDLPDRGITAIFGKSGCGKTTLLNVIGGLDSFAEGTLTIEGQNIKSNTDIIRNQYIGYIFQNYNLSKEETCFDNVANALRLCGMTDEKEIEERVMAALSNVDMEKYAKRTPDTLSGGQQQRIAIARAIVKNPPIILADEPTGNLDEANTVMIMDLLKAISKDHLVLLVTHEANLVDYYCDTVIELQDGKIVDKRQNSSANGLSVKDKNHIYLGELSHHMLSDQNAEIEYYGEKPEAPIKLKIVNSGGRIYVQIDTAKAQVIDEFSEVKLKEGVFLEKEKTGINNRKIDMSLLPPVKGTRFGRLFSLWSSIKSGYKSNFKNHKKGKKLLRYCMGLFAAIIVLVSAVFGTSIGDVIDARKAYNHNAFYVYTPNEDVSALLNEASSNSETGIDYIRLINGYVSGDTYAYFRTGTFETFSSYSWENNLSTNAVYLDVSMAADLELVEGKGDNWSDTDMLISTKVADALLEKSTLGYIEERSDLIGLVSDRLTIDGKNPRIAGIVESDESAIYLTATALAKLVLSTNYSTKIALGSDYGIEVAPGEAILLITEPKDGADYPKVGETIKIHERDIKITKIKYFCANYDQWLEANDIEKEERTFFYNLVKTENPGLDEGMDEFYQAVNEAMDKRYYEYYDYYYSEADSFLRDYYLFRADSVELWLYLEKGIEEAKYCFLPEEYYKATVYKELYGSYPTKEQLNQIYDSLPWCREELDQIVGAYEEEFISYSIFQNNLYLVNENEYVAFSKQIGTSHPTAVEPQMDEYYTHMRYTLVHSSDPDKTEAWLDNNFADLQDPDEYSPAIIKPNDVFKSIIAENAEGVIASIIVMVVIIVLMSLCMYLIMRSSLMNRIKEIGIYRAIGVSRKNLVFKFFIEAIVLTSLTVLVGFIVTSSFLFLCSGMSSLVKEVFYYPAWLAGADLLILYAISLFFGTLPILSLLRKTPSEILAKYDI